jgi:hypothetical protein
MKATRRSLVAMSLFLLLPVTAGAVEDLGIDPARVERVTKAIEGWVEDGRLPSAVLLIARYDKVAYLKAIGFRDREQKVSLIRP